MRFFSKVLLCFVTATFLTSCGSSGQTEAAQRGSRFSTEVTLKKLLGDCYSPQAILEAEPDLSVNGHILNQKEMHNIRWIKKCVLPLFPGEKEEKSRIAAEVTWWSLREGVLELVGEPLFAYANCHLRSGIDRVVSSQPLWNCDTNIWQVGMMAGQVMNYSPQLIAEKIQQVQESLGLIAEENELLEWTANLAGYPPGSEMSASIVESKGRVRRAWLVRNPIIGMLLTKIEVEEECITGSKRWCISGQYAEAKKFSGSRARMLRSIQDLDTYFATENSD